MLPKLPAKPKPSKKKLRKTPTTDPAQSARFLEMAKKLEADESGAAFDRAMNAVLPKPKGKA
jgi:hypothetical protein